MQLFLYTPSINSITISFYRNNFSFINTRFATNHGNHCIHMAERYIHIKNVTKMAIIIIMIIIIIIIANNSNELNNKWRFLWELVLIAAALFNVLSSHVIAKLSEFIIAKFFKCSRYSKAHILGFLLQSFLHTCYFISFLHSHRHLRLFNFWLKKPFLPKLYIYDHMKYVLPITLIYLFLLLHQIFFTFISSFSFETHKDRSSRISQLLPNLSIITKNGQQDLNQ